MNTPATPPSSSTAQPTITSEPVAKFLDQIQGIINRLAGQSAACKNWTAGLATGALLFVIEKDAKVPLWTLCPLVALLGWIDAYYLSLERDFVKVYSGFVKNVHAGTALWTDLYTIPAPAKSFKRVLLALKACLSLSVGPFYLAIIALVLGLHCRVSKPHPPSKTSQPVLSKPPAPATAKPQGQKVP